MATNRWISLATAGAFAVVGAGGCATMRDNPTACKVGTTLIGGALGGVGGGLGTSEIGKDPSNGDRAAGAGAGLVVGSLIGFGLGQLLCKEEAAPPPPPPPAAPPPPASKKIETLNGPNFDFNKATLRPEGKAKVDHAVRVMQDSPKMHVAIEGHTDSIGSDAYNQRLSERRADSVRDYMVAKGVSASRITTRGFGETRPVASNKTEEGRAENRRVDILAE